MQKFISQTLKLTNSERRLISVIFGLITGFLVTPVAIGIFIFPVIALVLLFVWFKSPDIVYWRSGTLKTILYYTFIVCIYLTFSPITKFDAYAYISILISLPIILYLLFRHPKYAATFFFGMSISFIIIEAYATFEFIHGLFNDKVLRVNSLTHNAFNLSVMSVYFAIMASYFKGEPSRFAAFSLVFSQSRSGLIALPFIWKKKRIFYFTLIFALAALIFFSNKYEDFDNLSSRTNLSQTASMRADTLTNPELKLKGYGFFKLNEIYGQNPHNVWISAVYQLGIFSIVFIPLLLYILIWYGYRFGWWKPIPIFAYSLIDDGLISTYPILAITILYLFFMALPKQQNRHK